MAGPVFKKEFDMFSRGIKTLLNPLKYSTPILATFRQRSGSKGNHSEHMLTKKKILVVIGIIVAILITFYTGVFGISTAV